MSWVQPLISILSGALIAATLAYFDSKELRRAIDSSVVRALVFSRDYSVVLFEILPTATAITVAIGLGVSWRVVWLIGVGGATLGLLRAFAQRSRPLTSVAFVACQPDETDRLELVEYEPDGSTASETFEGKEVLRMCEEDDVNYLYFRFSATIAAHMRRAHSVVFVIEYGDNADTAPAPDDLQFWINYDRSAEAPFKRAYARGIIGEAPWRLALFHVDDAAFRRRQQNLADFRVAALRSNARIRSVHVIGLNH